jgi:hypothetical protein
MLASCRSNGFEDESMTFGGGMLADGIMLNPMDRTNRQTHIHGDISS